MYKPRHPSLKAGVNERQFVDGSVSLVPKSSSHYPSLRAAVRDGRYVYGCMDGTFMAAGALLFINPSLQAGVRDDHVTGL